MSYMFAGFIFLSKVLTWKGITQDERESVQVIDTLLLKLLEKARYFLFFWNDTTL